VHAQEIDEAAGDERRPFHRCNEEFAHGQRRGADLPDIGKPRDVLRWKQVLEEEKMQRLDLLREIDGKGRGKPFVNVMDQFHAIAEHAANVLERGQRCSHILARMKVAAVQCALGRSAFVGCTGRSGECVVVRRPGTAIGTNLDADVTNANGEKAVDSLLDRLGIGGIGMAIDRCPLADLATEEIGIPARLPLMSQSAMSTPAMALFSTGLFRQ